MPSSAAKRVSAAATSDAPTSSSGSAGAMRSTNAPSPGLSGRSAKTSRRGAPPSGRRVTTNAARPARLSRVAAPYAASAGSSSVRAMGSTSRSNSAPQLSPSSIASASSTATVTRSARSARSSRSPCSTTRASTHPPMDTEPRSRPPSPTKSFAPTGRGLPPRAATSVAMATRRSVARSASIWVRKSLTLQSSIMASSASSHSRRISLAPAAFGSIHDRFQYHRSASGAVTPCPRKC